MTGGCGLERHRERAFHEFFNMTDEDVFISAKAERCGADLTHCEHRHLARFTLVDESASLKSLDANSDDGEFRAFPPLDIHRKSDSAVLSSECHHLWFWPGR